MWIKLKFGYFIASFVIGIIFCYVLAPPPEVVIKFPSPYNAGKIIYDAEDADDGCYKIDAKSVECPIDRTKIHKQPMS